VRNPIVNSLHNFCQFFSGNVNTINRSSPIIATIETRRIEALEIEQGWKARQGITRQDQAFYTRDILYISTLAKGHRADLHSVEASKRRSESAGHTDTSCLSRYRVVIGRLVLL